MVVKWLYATILHHIALPTNVRKVAFLRALARIAQLVEQRSPKPRVQSSSLCAPAKKKAIRISGWLFSVKFALRASEIASL